MNATQICKAGGKEFKHWNSLESTKELVLELKNILDTENFKDGIPTLDLIYSQRGGTNSGSWIHPDLAVQLA